MAAGLGICGGFDAADVDEDAGNVVPVEGEAGLQRREFAIAGIELLSVPWSSVGRGCVLDPVYDARVEQPAHAEERRRPSLAQGAASHPSATGETGTGSAVAEGPMRPCYGAATLLKPLSR